MTNAQVAIGAAVYLGVFIALFLGVAYVWVKGVSKDEFVPTEHSVLRSIRVKIYLYLFKATSRYKVILVMLSILWLIGKSFALANELSFTQSLHNQQTQTFALLIIVTTDAISEILGFLVAATLVKLYVDIVERR